jgi:hypothetical protein
VVFCHHRAVWRIITEKLNERAETRGIEDRYAPEDVAILALSGYDKLRRWW